MKIGPGTTFHAVYADSNPLWKVLSKAGQNVWLCEIVGDDVDWAGTQKAFLESEIKHSLAMTNLFDGLHREHDEFYKRLKPGQTIHYNNGFECWVRCVVVQKDGKNVLKPTALVGEWRKYDLPYRRPDGSIHYGYYADKIEKDETFTPNASNLYENGSKGNKDPRKLVPLDLSVPPMTSEEERTAQLWQQVQRIRDALDGTDPNEILNRVREIENNMAQS